MKEKFRKFMDKNCAKTCDTDACKGEGEELLTLKGSWKNTGSVLVSHKSPREVNSTKPPFIEKQSPYRDALIKRPPRICAHHYIWLSKKFPLE